jgi:endo-1,4-beta-xylanase
MVITQNVRLIACLSALLVAFFLWIPGNLAADSSAPGPNATPFRARRQFPAQAEWLDPDHGAPNATHYKTFYSKVLGSDVSYLVFLPPGYEQTTKRLPVIYWLHGMGGNQRSGAMSFVPQLDAAIRQGAMPSTIVVLVNGMVTSFYCDSTDGQCPVESVIVKDLILHIDKTYRTIPRREGRLVEGFSMGGYGAAHLAFKYPELFGAVVIDSGALIDPDLSRAGVGPLQAVFGDDKERRLAEHPRQLARKNAEKLRNQIRIHIGCGSLDDLLPRNRELHAALDDLKIEHAYEVVPGVAHNPMQYYKTVGTKFFAFHRQVLTNVKTDN